MKLIIAMAGALLLGGCSTSPNETELSSEQQLAKVENDDNYVCQTVRKTGSHFNKRRCITKDAQKREEENAKKTMEELDRNWNLNGG